MYPAHVVTIVLNRHHTWPHLWLYASYFLSYLQYNLGSTFICHVLEFRCSWLPNKRLWLDRRHVVKESTCTCMSVCVFGCACVGVVVAHVLSSGIGGCLFPWKLIAHLNSITFSFKTEVCPKSRALGTQLKLSWDTMCVHAGPSCDFFFGST